MLPPELHTQPLAIRPVTDHDVATLERVLAYDFPARHAARLELQRQGAAVYLVAWLGARPVGHVLLEWAGCPLEPMQSALPECPMASDLIVVDELRSQGIGSQLLAAVEARVRSAGYRRLGLAVAVDNVRAQALYHRHGYHDAGFAPYVDRWKETNEAGTEVWYEELERYLVRDLHVD